MRTLWIPGLPQSKGHHDTRVFAGRVQSYANPKTVAYETKVALMAKAAGWTPMEGPLHVSIHAFWPKKSGANKKVRSIPQWKWTRPDMSNIVKAIEDGLNGTGWVDDGQIATLHAEKVHLPETVNKVGVLIRVWAAAETPDLNFINALPTEGDSNGL